MRKFGQDTASYLLWKRYDDDDDDGDDDDYDDGGCDGDNYDGDDYKW